MPKSKKSLPLIMDSDCKHGLVRSKTCDKAEIYLTNAGLPKLEPCSNCSMVPSLETLSLVNKEAASKFLTSLGMESSSNIRTSDVLCPVHDQPILLDCSLSECMFSTTYPGVRNCILVYMSKHKVNELSSLDLSMLLEIPNKDIIEVSNQALKGLRKESISATTSLEFDPEFIAIKSKVCCACETPITEFNNYSSFSGFYHCSTSCQEAKPYSIAMLEASSGTSIEKLLNWARFKYATLAAFQQALGLDTSLLNKLTTKYLGKPLNKLYAKPVIPVVRSLNKRVGRHPSWLDAFPVKTKKVRSKMRNKYGSLYPDLAKLQDAVDDILL
jgi:hypothetical protein